MADNRQVITGVDWNEVFSFSHIFKSFRMSIHLSKLLLALAAIVLIFVTGWVMDRVWSMGGGYAGHNLRPAEDEIYSYLTMSSVDFREEKEDRWLYSLNIPTIYSSPMPRQTGPGWMAMC